ncbi:patatin-like phospholipase family protein [Chloroflexota bacterium]
MSVQSNKKIGYALGGGAARGLSHIGVLKVLENNNIFPDIITGTSIGALIGALYAGGITINDIEQLALRLDFKRLVLLADMTMPISGLIGGKRVISLLKSILGDLTFSQLKYDFACVATDIRTGEQVILREGSLVEAIRASISLPGIFTPVKIEGRYLVDGGLVNEVPVSVCRQMGAEYVIGVNVIPEPNKIGLGSKKSQAVHTDKLTKLKGAGDGKMLPTLPHVPSQFLQSRVDDVESSIKTLLQYQTTLKKKMLKSLDWMRMETSQRFQRKTPSLIHVLTQTITIAEYRVAVENLKDANLVINPEVEDIGFWQFDKAALAVAVGEKAASYAIQHGEKTSLLS